MVRFDLERFIDELRHTQGGDERQAAVQEVVQRAVQSPRSLLAALGEPSRAGIFTLYRDGGLTVLNIVWAPLMVLLPHDHRMWATIGIYTGREDNIFWRRAASRISACDGHSLSEREVLSLPSDAVHSVVNPIEKLTAAIHVYGGDFFAPGRSEWDPATLTERPFDTERNLRRFDEANARYLAGLALAQPAPSAPEANAAGGY
jgi:predicted metal-dependent enzyme (double-stranded beta helix superfamily)